MPFLTKILERVVAGQINEHLLISYLYKFQSVYRTSFSTETALIKITDDILYALDNNSFTALIMIDVSAAFDTVYIILLNRLSKCYGINNTALSWFKSYLSKRSQCVSVNNCASEPYLLSSGVPQSCVLAPLLSTLYMKSLASLISNFGFGYHVYADDVQFYITFNHTNAFDARVIANSLKAVEQKLTLNRNKTHYMVFSRKQSV